MKIIIIGAAGFIGTNLAIRLAKEKENKITLVDSDMSFFSEIKKHNLDNLSYKEMKNDSDDLLNELLSGQEILFHLMSTTAPATSNQKIPLELYNNVIESAKIFEACIRQNIKKVVFISSGGTVYGQESRCPISENMPLKPISSYGLQKVTIEKLLYLYNYIYGLDYRIVRLANPYGPYQRPNGRLGAVTTFTYRALMGNKIEVYGDGSVVRDYIFIDDAINGIMNITFKESNYKVFNLGSGYGISINELLEKIRVTLDKTLDINYVESRRVDVPVNYLDISRYEMCFGKLNPIELSDGIRMTAQFLYEHYGME